MGAPQDSGGRKVDFGCIKDRNQEGLSGDHEMHDQHVCFYVSTLTNARNPSSGKWVLDTAKAIFVSRI